MSMYKDKIVRKSIPYDHNLTLISSTDCATDKQ